MLRRAYSNLLSIIPKLYNKLCKKVSNKAKEEKKYLIFWDQKN